MESPAGRSRGRTRSAGVLVLGCALCLGRAAAGEAPVGPVKGTVNEPDPVPRVLDEIVVVAHKTGRSIREVAANVTVIGRDDLDIDIAASLADVFRYTPGINYEASGSRFGVESVNIRGIGGNRVAMLLDGVPLSDQFDIGSFSNATRNFIDAGFVDQVEVLHGPASALYGSAAIGGVVAFRTPDPRDYADGRRRRGSLALNWRSANAGVQGTAMQGITAGPAAVLLGVSALGASEFDAGAVDTNINQRRENSHSAMLKAAVDDPLGNSFQAAWYGQRSDVTSSLDAVLGTGRFRSTSALEGDDEYAFDLLSLEYRFGSEESYFDDGVVRVYGQLADVEQRTYDERTLAARPVAIDRLFSFEQKLAGVEINLQKSVVVAGMRHRLGFGLEYRERRTEEFRDGLETGLLDGMQTRVILGEEFPLRDFPISRSSERGVYLEDTVSVGDWTVIAALRADTYEIDPHADAMYLEDFGFNDVVDIHDSAISPKLGLIYHASDWMDVYAQYSQGFRAPPYEDANIGLDLPLFNVRAIPNPDLESERSAGIDIGFRLKGSYGTASLSLFRTDYDDFIESKVRLGIDPDSGRLLFQSQNIDRARIEGIEAGAEVTLGRIAEGLTLGGSFYMARGRNRDSGLPLNSVGPAQAALSANWTSGDGRWRLRLRGTRATDWSDRNESAGALFDPGAHTLVDVFVARRIGERTTLRAAVLNATDETYWAWSDTRGLAPDDPVIPFLARPGRSFGVGLDMNW